MRIAFVYDAPYPWHVGGIEMINYRESKELAKDNEVHYFARKWPGMKRDFVQDGVSYHASYEVTQGKLYRHGRRSIREAMIFSLGLFGLYSYPKFDVIITNQFPVLHLPVLKLYSMLTGTKLVVEVAEVWDRNYWVSYLGPVLGRLASVYSDMVVRYGDVFVAYSSATADKLSEKGIDRYDVKIFAPVLDNELIDSINKRYKPANNKTVLFSGRLIKEKRIEDWLGAVKAARAKDNDAKGMIIGSGPELERIRSRIAELGLKDSVEVRHFYADKGDFYRELRKASVLLNMSEREGLSIICIEAVALGTPVILPSYSPIPNEVKEMCNVVHENEVPSRMHEIFRARDKSAFIKKQENLRLFSTSMIKNFYIKLFNEIGIKHRHK